jgi:hypothetical protein
MLRGCLFYAGSKLHFGKLYVANDDFLLVAYKRLSSRPAPWRSCRVDEKQEEKRDTRSNVQKM